MGEVIDFRDKRPASSDNLITSEPWEFRLAKWETPHFAQMLKVHSSRLEVAPDHSSEETGQFVSRIPPHFTLKGGLAYTIRAMYLYRKEEDRMREAYHLTGLIDCMINQVNPVLRTDLLRDMYKKIFSMKGELNVNWYGNLDHVLLPIDRHFHNESEYRASLARAGTLKELYHTIWNGTDQMFDILSSYYVFYCPGMRG
jgi:hypothetical protein